MKRKEKIQYAEMYLKQAQKEQAFFETVEDIVQAERCRLDVRAWELLLEEIKGGK